jgi:hypothetical protein
LSGIVHAAAKARYFAARFLQHGHAGAAAPRVVPSPFPKIYQSLAPHIATKKIQPELSPRLYVCMPTYFFHTFV